MASLKEEMHKELLSILNYWESNTVDTTNGGFIGAIDFTDTKDYSAEKGSVLNARILWAFSASYAVTKDVSHLRIAERAYKYILKNFYDVAFGGIFWSLNTDGTPKDTKNQVYALAFTIYGLSEFYAASKNEEALQLAVNLFEKIEEHSFDKEHKGYFEAFTRDWKPIDDLRLSDKDANEKKTMNTHLHIVEGYANLYRVWPEERLKEVITQLLITINDHFINAETGHLHLFFNEEWVEKPDVISYGHDIEAAWLLQWCAEVIKDESLIAIYKKHAVTMADATFEGIDDIDGGLWYEFDPYTEELIAEKHWWPQSELLIGMVNAWQLTGNDKYLNAAQHNWQFVKDYIIDKLNGEWIWGVDIDYAKIEKDKAGFWKCPYHNARACLELINRLP
ncbi:AGE family epimerase/isomerase [Flavobacterium subsaxonicum]|uniref:Cellobiose 2-epimerase n=1 Tax=Flavobacterium subsaxonicum WB 4.1-42 = DSM 21790 TaxID=1121898 RepID=A0A0A2MNP4_9FLAO|nr:AGE family epimerase/isomerase [Flavobacterium subsaxonicum]KGO94292.1 N-acyl-D-glucosamine 2-epimerase [Flavobacterium subsaxonicum WB 4.1-42 = DSM 21790]